MVCLENITQQYVGLADQDRDQRGQAVVMNTSLSFRKTYDEDTFSNGTVLTPKTDQRADISTFCQEQTDWSAH